jgi:hypothetical protein
MVEYLLDHALKSIVFLVKVLGQSARTWGTGQWYLAEATITAPPSDTSGFGCPSVEIVYSYRFKGELYTGIHEEPFLSSDSLTDYVERFGEGKTIVVRVKPSDSEVSVVRESDQGLLTCNFTLSIQSHEMALPRRIGPV